MPSGWIGGALAGLLLLPVAFLAVYRARFGFHPFVVVFGSAAVLLIAAPVAFLALAHAAPHRRRRGSRGAWLIGGLAALLALVVAFILAGAALSNALWGDTLNARLVLTFARHADRLFDFLPLPEDERRSVLLMALAAVIVVAAGIATLAAFVTARATLRLREAVARAPGRRPRLFAALFAGSALAAAACLAIATLAPRTLYGEPISSFVELLPVSRLLAPDNARLAAAIEDRASRAAYRAPADFAPRNVVLVVADSLRADRMGVYGYGRADTPFLSRLMDEGRLHRVDMALSTCSESFCGIATTLASRPFHEITGDNFKLHALLRDLGYRIRFFLGGDHRSWSYLFDFYGAEVDEIYDHRTLAMDMPNDDRPLLAALDAVPPAGGQPAFFYFFLMSTHVTGVKLPEFARYQPTEIDLPRALTFWNELAGRQRPVGEAPSARAVDPETIEALANRYDNGVLQTDANIARIFAALEAKGYLRDSVVVITGDHGDGLGEHGHVGHTRYLYQEDIRVPLLVFGDGVAALRNDAFATQIDIAPTVLALLGLPVPAGWRGVPLSTPPGERITLHQTRRGQMPCFAVVERTAAALWKYMRCGDGDDGEALFDLLADPAERNNLVADADAARLARYRREIDSRFGVVINPCASFECVD